MTLALEKSASYQPTIALQLVKTTACCKAVVLMLTKYGYVPSEAVEALVNGLKQSIGTVKDLVPELLSASALFCVKDNIKETENTFASICGLKAIPQTENKLVAALQQTGAKIADASPSSLKKHKNWAGVAELEKLLELKRTASWIMDGNLETALKKTYESEILPQGEKKSINEIIAQIVPQGYDGEALVWAIIGMETNHHLRLVWHQANKLAKIYPDRSSADLFGWGWTGLRTALRNFDPEKGFLFSTYACTRISGTIRDGVRSENPVPKRLTTYVRKVAAAEENLAQTLGRAPALAEVAAHLEEDLAQLKILPRLQPTASIEEITELSKERGSAPRWLIDDADPANSVVASACRAAIEKALLKLPENERTAVRLLVMDAIDPKEARSLTGANTRQMRARKEKGLALLKTHLQDWDLTKNE